MRYGLGLGSILILASAIGALATTQNVLSFTKPRPLVIWHGLGASALFPGTPGALLDMPAALPHR